MIILILLAYDMKKIIKIINLFEQFNQKDFHSLRCNFIQTFQYMILMIQKILQHKIKI